MGEVFGMKCGRKEEKKMTKRELAFKRKKGLLIVNLFLFSY